MVKNAPRPIMPSCLGTINETLLCFIPGETFQEDIYIYVVKKDNRAAPIHRPVNYERTYGAPINKTEWNALYWNQKETLRQLGEDELANIQKALDQRQEFLRLSPSERSDVVKKSKNLQVIPASQNPFAGLDKLLRIGFDK